MAQSLGRKPKLQGAEGSLIFCFVVEIFYRRNSFARVDEAFNCISTVAKYTVLKPLRKPFHSLLLVAEFGFTVNSQSCTNRSLLPVTLWDKINIE